MNLSRFWVHRDKIFFIQIENWLIHPRLVIDCNAFLYKRIKNFVRLDRHNNAIILFLYWKTDYYTSFMWNQLSLSMNKSTLSVVIFWWKQNQMLLYRWKQTMLNSMETMTFWTWLSLCWKYHISCGLPNFTG